MLTPENEEMVVKLLQDLVVLENRKSTNWNSVIHYGRQYALMKLSCSYIENGQIVRISPSDQSRMLDQFQHNLLSACVYAFSEDAVREFLAK